MQQKCRELELYQIAQGGFGVIYVDNNNFVYKGVETSRQDSEKGLKLDKKQEHKRQKAIEILKNEEDIYRRIQKNGFIKGILPMYESFQRKNEYLLKIARRDIDLNRYSIYFKLSEQVIYDILTNSLFIVRSLHKKGVIHSDIKPENFLLHFNEDCSFFLSLCDFGLSQKGESTTKSIKGTDQLIDPVFIIEGKLTYYSDFWSLAIMTLQLLKLSTKFLIVDAITANKKSKSPSDIYNSIQLDINKILALVTLQPLKKTLETILKTDPSKRIYNDILQFSQYSAINAKSQQVKHFESSVLNKFPKIDSFEHLQSDLFVVQLGPQLLILKGGFKATTEEYIVIDSSKKSYFHSKQDFYEQTLPHIEKILQEKDIDIKEYLCKPFAFYYLQFANQTKETEECKETYLYGLLQLKNSQQASKILFLCDSNVSVYCSLTSNKLAIFHPQFRILHDFQIVCSEKCPFQFHIKYIHKLKNNFKDKLQSQNQTNQPE